MTLAANTEYYLGSAEVSGGDRWYSYDTVVTTGGAATVLAGAYDIGAGWVNVGVAGNSYVPVSLQHCATGGCVETGLVSSFTPGTLRNNAGGYRGMKFRTGASAVEVTGLGRVYVTGNSQTHQLILETAAGATLASVNWTPAGGVHNQIKYVALGAPVTLAANTEYYLGSAEVSGGDRWYSYDTVVTTSGAATVLAGAYDIGAGWVSVGGSGE